jgi:hypothetical protein
MRNETKVESRITGNVHFAEHLRTRLLRRASPAVREILSNLSDSQLIEAYLKNEKLGREHTARRRAEQGKNL